MEVLVPFNIFRVSVFALIALANIGLGFFILFRGKNKKVRQSFFWLAFFQFLFALSYALLFTFPSQALLFAKTTWTGLFAVAASIVFLNVFLGKVVRWWKYLLLFAPLTITFILSITTDLVIIEQRAVGNLYYEYTTGPLEVVGRILSIFFLLWIVYILISSYRKQGPRMKIKLKYFFLGFFVYFLFAIVFAGILPLFFSEAGAMTELVPIASFIWLSFIAYVIIRYRLFEIRTIFHKTLAWLVLLIITTLPFVGLYFVLFYYGCINDWGWPIAIALLFILTQFSYFIYNLLKPRIDHLFARKKYQKIDVIKDFSKSLHSLFNTTELIKILKDEIESIFYPDNINIILLNKKTKISPKLKKQLKEKQILSKGFDEKLDKDFNNLKAEIIIPLVQRGEVLGLITLGEKKNLKPYTAFDYELMDILMTESSLAIENSLFYQESLETIKKKNELEQLKTEFVTIFAHQMRTPLSIVRWNLDSLSEDLGPHMTKDQKETCTHVMEANKNAVNIVNELLDVAQLERNKITYNFKKSSLNNLVKELKQDLKIKTKEKNVEIVIKQPRKNILVEMDELKMRVAIFNLIDNAISYSPAGKKVTVDLSTKDGKAILKIIDQGIGIAKAAEKKIFEKFYRSPRAMKVEVTGSGLGLYLTRRLIKGHKGTINFTSKAGKGTTFVISLPLG